MVKAQSAIEYLTTYGWAIIIIAVTLAALYTLGLFSPSAFVNNSCIFPADFGCMGVQLYANGTLNLNLVQSSDASINVTGVACNVGGTIMNVTLVSPPVDLPIGSNGTFTIPCYSNATILNDQPGSVYRGYILVDYTSLQTGFQHVLRGTLVQRTS